MKKIFLTLTFIFQFIAQGATADVSTSAVVPSAMSVNLNGERPSCEMLAWRFITSLSRLAEANQLRDRFIKKGVEAVTFASVATRLASDNFEGSTAPVEQVIEFQIPEVSSENFQVLKINSPAVQWINETPNMTDSVTFTVQPGLVKMTVQMPYTDYCFHRGSSSVIASIKGVSVGLTWNTAQKDLNRYLRLIH